MKSGEYCGQDGGLRPTEKDNFVLNRPEAIANVISGAFDVVGLAGWIIGGFSIYVGGFGIANIMFVSVKKEQALLDYRNR
jgi:putative ABC transport system permease protein